MQLERIAIGGSPRIHNPHIGAFGLVVFQRTDRNNPSNMIRGLLEWKHRPC